MIEAKTTVEILNRSLEKVAEIRNLYPINENGDVLRYTKELSDYGECRFRVSTKDPVFDEFGDILIPHKFHVRVRRSGTIVWQGAIVDNSSRNKNYQEIVAYEYLIYFDKSLVKRTKEAETGEGFHYREYTSGTMATNISTTITEMKDLFGANHIMAGLTLGTIENPNYPDGFITAADAPLTGPWNFSADLNLIFDYHSVLFVIQAFAMYSKSDFLVDNDLAFHFKDFVGNKQPSMVFAYGISNLQGNIVDYDIPRYGRRMANDLFGIAVGEEGRVLYHNKRDEASIQEYGLLQAAMAMSDVKGTNPLKARIEEQLRFVKLPENSPINLVINEKGYPLGQYDIGDIVRVRIKDNVIDYNDLRRIVRISVTLHNTGRELTTISTNPPREEDIGA